MGQARRQFPTTSWTLVRQAGAEAGNHNTAALEELLRRYLPALQAHLRHVKGIPTDQAENLLQSFILDKVIQQQLIARADQRKGRFRTFLLTVLDNYVRNARRQEAVRNRHVQRHDDVAHSRAFREPGHNNLPPHAVFDVQWAQQILDETVRRMEAQCRESESTVAWEVFVSRILGPIWHGEPSESYEALVERLGLSTPAQAHNAMATAKRMFRRALHGVVSEYARDPVELEEEIAELKQVLSNAGASTPVLEGRSIRRNHPDRGNGHAQAH